jgi:phage tail tape-measure protein
VDCVESLLGSELGGWLSKMQDALDDLRKDEEQSKPGSASADAASSRTAS